ncbi:ribulose-phosphate 3-epimerase [Agrobacterium salinitolerans]|uniref:ribulose-phosphate 3-epimerase n=1 Tax=Agrobacterium salinitolerans TaxID=1183413 RepID=UPI0020B3CA8F|nr:ribulose-phosphate 3-epimerase [Agrobacterium salinitolerans]
MAMKAAANWFEALPRDRLLGEFSLWSADLANLEREIARVDPHVDIYHADVADGRFAPSFLFFPDQLSRIRKLTFRPIHVHLMVEGDIVLSQIRQFAEAGADLISIHPENGAVTPQAIALIRELGPKAGVVLRLETPVETIRPLVADIDFVTLLGTAIGVKGQGLSKAACPRLIEAAAILKAQGRGDVVLAADGGIRDNTVPLLREAGAQTVVLGSLAFNDPDLAGRIAWLRAL